MEEKEMTKPGPEINESNESSLMPNMSLCIYSDQQEFCGEESRVEEE